MFMMYLKTKKISLSKKDDKKKAGSFLFNSGK